MSHCRVTSKVVLCLFSAFGLLGSTAFSQQTSSREASAADTLVLAPFEVNSKSDKGYGATESVSASRVNVPIMDLANSLITINPQLIQDINPLEISDAAKYVSGVNLATAHYGGQFTVRGYNIIGANHRDGLPEVGIGPPGGGAMDFTGVERLEIIKGPAGTLYGAHGVGGLINYVTLKPSPEYAASIKLTTGSDSFMRADLQTTGPLTKDKSLLFRLDAAYQDANLQFGLPFDREAIAPYLEYRIGSRSKIWTRFRYLKAHVASDTASWFTDVNLDFSTFIPRTVYTAESDEFRESIYRNYELGMSTSVEVGESTWDFRLVARAALNSWNQITYQLFNYNMLNSAGVVIGHFGTNAALPTDRFDNPNLAQIIANRVVLDDPRSFDDGLINLDIVGNFKLGPTKHQFLTNMAGTMNQAYVINYQYDYPDIDVTDGDITHLAGDPKTYRTNKRRVQESKTNGHAVAFGFQDNMSVLNDRLILVGGARYDWRQQTDTNIFLNAGGITENVNQWTFKYGAVGKVAKGVALFYNYSETFSPVVTRDVTNNQRFPNLLGSTKEGGIKTDLFDSRLIATFSYFDMVLENSTIFVNDPMGGPGKLIAEGTALTKGWELDVAASPVQGLNLIVGVEDISSKTDSGVRRRGVSQGVSYKIFGTYQFQKGLLKGLTFGGGYNYQNKRAGDTVDILKLPAYDLAEAMIAYGREHWRLQLNVYNLLDDTFPLTSVNRNKIWASEPRNFRLSASYNF